MTIYSIVPLETIFDVPLPTEPLEEIQVDGIIMQVKPRKGYQAEIVRIISPNPQDYLNAKYAPGQMLKFQPTVDR